MNRTHKAFSYCLSGLLLTVVFLLATNLPAVAGQSVRDDALFAEPGLGSTPFSQGTRSTGSPDSTFGDP